MCGLTYNNNQILLHLVKSINTTGHIALRLDGNSMSPALPSGTDIRIIKYPINDIAEGDIIAILFQNSSHFIIHRVIHILVKNGNRVFVTKGDNNSSLDPHPVYPGNYVGLVQITRKPHI